MNISCIELWQQYSMPIKFIEYIKLYFYEAYCFYGKIARYIWYTYKFIIKIKLHKILKIIISKNMCVYILIYKDCFRINNCDIYEWILNFFIVKYFFSLIDIAWSLKPLKIFTKCYYKKKS